MTSAPQGALPGPTAGGASSMHQPRRREPPRSFDSPKAWAQNRRGTGAGLEQPCAGIRLQRKPPDKASRQKRRFILSLPSSPTRALNLSPILSPHFVATSNIRANLCRPTNLDHWCASCIFPQVHYLLSACTLSKIKNNKRRFCHEQSVFARLGRRPQTPPVPT